MNIYNELKDLGYVIMWSIVAITIVMWIIHEIKESAFQSGYWKGREAGWNSHRRMTNIKQQSDEVFDYDKN